MPINTSYNSVVILKDQKIQVEIADSFNKRAKGLMGREFLPTNSGMLFIFEKEGIYPFWMANTLINLDIIWIDKNLKIVDISKNTPPCKAKLLCKNYFPKHKALFVLELNGNWCEKNKVEIGDFVEIKR